MEDFVINKLLTEKPVDETMKLYSTMAQMFNDVAKGSNYHFPEILVKEFLSLNIPHNVRILDVGAGTGNVGKLLHASGYKNIDALDGCEEMLSYAKQLNGVYKQFITAIVKSDTQLPINDRTYDVVLMSGVTCPSHIDVENYQQIFRLLKSGGIIGWIKEDDYILGRNSERYRDGSYQKSLEKYLKEKKLIEMHGFNPKRIPNATLGRPGDLYFFEVQ
ncbi:malonyl-[acyl-carrier protein] O-methyltransferase-like protein [Leptotrombidium deliense]|uniref:Malonyl-[acyl-carrier protein] O-methyltransferase-like protein n=1 Tax=Leptotrombidium deliense TaxID=299467 RepID=A0A443SE12_9ACAR|nr:malonyl-[acyl-carrier protein] O-methyltransferase-like protein [Leptotrombidium deliense]